jgi:hypothetical protein
VAPAFGPWRLVGTTGEPAAELLQNLDARKPRRGALSGVKRTLRFYFGSLMAQKGETPNPSFPLNGLIAG